MRGTVPNEFTGMRTARLPDGSMQSGGIPHSGGARGQRRRSAPECPACRMAVLSPNHGSGRRGRRESRRESLAACEVCFNFNGSRSRSTGPFSPTRQKIFRH
jgi:hypothetical protein